MSKTLRACLLGASVILAGGVSAASAQAPATFRVGYGVRSVAPSAALIASGRLYLGGYGLSNGSVGNGMVEQGRAATGVMTVGVPSVRAVAIGDGVNTIVLSDLDNQGFFSALKPNYQTGAARPYGIDDIRRQVQADTGVPMTHVVISSDHSHAGQDLTGAWGFVPDEYLAFVRDQAVAAIDDAIRSQRDAVIYEGAVDTPSPCDGANPPDNILNNQFSCTDIGQSSVDTELRVMQARDASTNRTIVTITNFAAHATVGGSGNTLVSADWPGAAAEQTEALTGAPAMTLVADVGRSQPNRSSCSAAELASGAYATDPRDVDTSCSMSKYGSQVLGYAQQALAAAQPLTQSGVTADTYWIREVAHNAALVGLVVAGDVVGAPIARQVLPPYMEGDSFGTYVSAFRIGGLLVTTNPGEAYPNIREGVMAAVSGPDRFWTIGLANDQFGYLIAPISEYEIPIQYAVVNGNDNYLFNVSHTFGEHVMCTQELLASNLGFTVSTLNTPAGRVATSPAECQALDAPAITTEANAGPPLG
ncbi:MAG: hypothetical protein ACYDAY_00135 [Candidatus Dormibacteria bacterium]